MYEDTASYFNIEIEDLVEYHSDRSLKEKPSLLFSKYQRESLKQYFFSLLYVLGASDKEDTITTFNKACVLGSLSMTSYLFE